jgi:hypothetical protein
MALMSELGGPRTFADAKGFVEQSRSKIKESSNNDGFIRFETWAAPKVVLGIYKNIDEARKAFKEACEDPRNNTCLANGETLLYQFDGISMKEGSREEVKSGNKMSQNLESAEDVKSFVDLADGVRGKFDQDIAKNRLTSAPSVCAGPDIDRSRIDYTTHEELAQATTSDVLGKIVGRQITQKQELLALREQKLMLEAMDIIEEKQEEERKKQEKKDDANKDRIASVEILELQSLIEAKLIFVCSCHKAEW